MLADSALSFAERLQSRGLRSLGDRTRVLAASLGGDEASIVIDGMTIRGSLLHHGRYLRLLTTGGFGSPLFALGVFEQALSAGMVVVDCGAHIGLYTVLAANWVGPTGKVISLEPDPVNIEVLRANVEVNGSGTESRSSKPRRPIIRAPCGCTSTRISTCR